MPSPGFIGSPNLVWALGIVVSASRERHDRSPMAFRRGRSRRISSMGPPRVAASQSRVFRGEWIWDVSISSKATSLGMSSAPEADDQWQAGLNHAAGPGERAAFEATGG
jgi:hypothetical protein